MGASTRWIDRETSELETAIGLLTDEVDPDDRNKSIVWDNWSFTRVFPENLKITLNGRTIIYNMVRYNFDQITADGAQHAERITSAKSGFIIAYKTESSLNYIIDQNSIAQKMLRKLLSYSGKNEIEKNMFDLTDDFFVWLINRMYKENRTIETGADGAVQYELKVIRSFRGAADDLQTKVSASGESVMNLISTLSFLLESNRLSTIQMDLSCTWHENISLILQRGTVSLEDALYQGKYETDKPDEKLAKLHLMVYLEVLPNLLQEYNSDKENDMWNRGRYCDFLTDVATDLQTRIESKIDIINAGRIEEKIEEPSLA